MPPQPTGNATQALEDTGNPTLDAKLAALDDDLAPLNPSDESHETDAPEKPATEAAEESTDAAEAEKKAEETADDEGYTIEEAGEEEADDQSSTPTPPTPPAAPAAPEDQYILDHIKDYAITVRGRVGDGEIQTFKVLAPEQLPDGFSYVDGREMSVANKSFSLLEQKALQLQQDYRSQQAKAQADDFAQRERVADRADIGRLQKNGELPRFKVADPESPAFEQDPGVVLVQSVLDYKDTRNQRYLDEYNAGRPYRHIGFEEAFRMYKAEHPTDANPAQQQEDKARKDLARRTSRATGTPVTRNDATPPRIHSGMTSRDLDLLIENMEL